MPIYEYRCKDCGHYLDVLQKISDDPLKECPACEQPEGLRRLISAPAFRLKGGGWYETDFKSEKEKRRNLADGGDAKSESGSSGDAKSESGSAGGGESKSGEGGGGTAKSGEGSAKPDSASKTSGGGSQSKAAV